MKTQAETDVAKLTAKMRYRDALERFQKKHLDFRLLAAEAIDGNNRADDNAVQPEQAQTAPAPPDSELPQGPGSQSDADQASGSAISSGY